MYHKFSDDGKSLHGAYGKRIFMANNTLESSWERIKQLLRDDPDTRRAVLPIYSSIDVGYQSNDIPCTCLVQYFIRENKLCSIVYMRANDLFLGTPYDVFSFSMLQEYLACELGVEIGSYRHVVGSLCVFEKNQLTIESISNSKPVDIIEMPKMTKLDTIQKQKILKNEEKIRQNKKIDYDGIDKYWKNVLYVIQLKADENFEIPSDAYDYVHAMKI